MTASTFPAGTKPGNRKPRSLTLTEAGTNAVNVVWVPVLRVRWRKDVTR